MSSYMAVLLGSMAVLVACGAVATLGRGWLPPWLRGRFVRPALFGWAQLAMTTALAAQLVGGLLITSQDVRFTVTMSGAMVMLLATGLIGLAQRRRRTVESLSR